MFKDKLKKLIEPKGARSGRLAQSRRTRAAMAAGVLLATSLLYLAYAEPVNAAVVTTWTILGEDGQILMMVVFVGVLAYSVYRHSRVIEERAADELATRRLGLKGSELRIVPGTLGVGLSEKRAERSRPGRAERARLSTAEFVPSSVQPGETIAAKVEKGTRARVVATLPFEKAEDGYLAQEDCVNQRSDEIRAALEVCLAAIHGLKLEVVHTNVGVSPKRQGWTGLVLALALLEMHRSMPELRAAKLQWVTIHTHPDPAPAPREPAANETAEPVDPIHELLTVLN